MELGLYLPNYIFWHEFCKMSELSHTDILQQLGCLWFQIVSSGKTHGKSYPKIQFKFILDRYFKNYGNINAIWPLFGMGSYQLWSYHVTQVKNLLFS